MVGRGFSRDISNRCTAAGSRCRRNISKLNADLKSKQADVDRIFQDQERLRENMKALKGTPEEKALAQRYTGELDDQEMRLATLRTEISNLETAQKQALQDLDAMIEKLTFEANL